VNITQIYPNLPEMDGVDDIALLTLESTGTKNHMATASKSWDDLPSGVTKRGLPEKTPFSSLISSARSLSIYIYLSKEV
jgi:hypothetical protein